MQTNQRRATIASLVCGLVVAVAILGYVGRWLGFLTSEFPALLVVGAAAMAGAIVGGIVYLSVIDPRSRP